MTESQVTEVPTAGEPVSTSNKVLETGAKIVQDFTPVNSICAHLNAFHLYADDPRRCVEAHHYCSHISEDLRQCLLYDSKGPSARLIGIEYMITPRLFKTLPTEEKHLWHTHVFEVKSGELIMPQPTTSMLPKAAWDAAEKAEMEQVVELYGKTWHLWQVDRGDQLPLGEPKLMVSLTSEEDTKMIKGFPEMLKDRDTRYGVSTEEKKEQRKDIQEPPGVGKRDGADWWKEKLKRGQVTVSGSW